jgi:hypothetical protein
MMGKKLYKTSMLNVFRLIILGVVIFFFNNFYLETFTNPKFRLEAQFQILDVLEYHLKYPREFINFFCLIIIPAIYYAFIRGISFHEKGFIYNGGLPFMNRGVSFTEVAQYKLLHPELAISIHTKKGDVFVVADNNIGRVIAILDQHNIQGDFAPDEFVKLITNYRKFIFFMLGVIFLLFLLRKLGVS